MKSSLIVTLAYLLWVDLGLRTRLDYEPSQWCTKRRAQECSVLTIGRALVGGLNY